MLMKLRTSFLISSLKAMRFCRSVQHARVSTTVAAAVQGMLRGWVMYHEEKIIDGQLCFRVTPDGKWWPSANVKALAIGLLLQCNHEEMRDAIKKVQEYRGE
jgi:hypothetical protein